jgi:hypothetical protein
MCRVILSAMAILGVPVLLLADNTGKYFTITIVDDQTGRGVPMVELSTVNHIRCVTDSNGVVAFHEPGLMNQSVFFHVKSHGYEFAKDGFGFRGKSIEVKEGGHVTLKIKRVNIAERLYRITGAGIYRDSVLAGKKVPIKEPVLNAQVLGSDSVVNTVYKGKMIWFWGDTNRPSYPLGNFHVPGAISLLPGKGGLDPERGINLEYFADAKGFAKETAHLPGEGPTWITGLVKLAEKDGRERLFATYMKVKGFLDVYERGLVEWSDQKKQFEPVVRFPKKAPFYPIGQTYLNGNHVYYANPYPLVRVLAQADQLKRLEDYEAYTCLEEGSGLKKPRLDRAEDGMLRYGWKPNTPSLGPAEQAKLIKAGKMKPAEGHFQLQNVDTGKPILAHSGSVYWNPYRRRWIMIAVESGGTSPLGEVWFAEADVPHWSYVYARKIVTHDQYSFYNPKQHPQFDKDNGRIIFFEGTYTALFSGNKTPTPRYDYNQIMYRLDLSDPRLALPVAIYVQTKPNRSQRFGNFLSDLWKEDGTGPLAFFALDRPGFKTVPVYESALGLQIGPPKLKQKENARLVFHALPADMPNSPATTVPLYVFKHKDGRRVYSTDPSPPLGFQRVEGPLCRVWHPHPLVTDYP